MDITIYQDALVGIEAFGQGINAGLQTAVDFWTQGFKIFGGNTAAVEAGTDITGLSSQLGADADASLTTPETDNGLELGLDTGIEVNL